jgi:hypothetical protein
MLDTRYADGMRRGADHPGGVRFRLWAPSARQVDLCLEDGAWRGRRWEEAVIYELHVASFTPRGIFAGARSSPASSPSTMPESATPSRPQRRFNLKTALNAKDAKQRKGREGKS